MPLAISYMMTAPPAAVPPATSSPAVNTGTPFVAAPPVAEPPEILYLMTAIPAAVIPAAALLEAALPTAVPPAAADIHSYTPMGGKQHFTAPQEEERRGVLSTYQEIVWWSEQRKTREKLPMINPPHTLVIVFRYWTGNEITFAGVDMWAPRGKILSQMPREG